MDEKSSLLTVKQLQDLLQVDRITIYRMLKDGKLSGFKVGGQWRFSRQAIDDWLRQQSISLEALDLPDEAGDNSYLSEELPLSCMQAIQSIFAESLGMGTVTTSLDGSPLTAISNSCEFCNLILGTHAGWQRCVASWRAAVSQYAGRPSIITCHAGLCYIGSLIEIQGKASAAIYAGQFLDSPPDNVEWNKRIEELVDATGIKRAALQEALDAVSVLDEAKRRKLPHFVELLADTFAEIGQERLALINRLRRIAEITTLS